MLCYAHFAVLYARFAVTYARFAVLYARFAVLYACFAVLYVLYHALHGDVILVYIDILKQSDDCLTIMLGLYEILYTTKFA